MLGSADIQGTTEITNACGKNLCSINSENFNFTFRFEINIVMRITLLFL